jgi:hypothetical protein
VLAFIYLSSASGSDKLQHPRNLPFEVSGQPTIFILYTLSVTRDVARAQVAQLVEQWTENPRVGGSSPPLGTIFLTNTLIHLHFVWIRQRG